MFFCSKNVKIYYINIILNDGELIYEKRAYLPERARLNRSVLAPAYPTPSRSAGRVEAFRPARAAKLAQTNNVPTAATPVSG